MKHKEQKRVKQSVIKTIKTIAFKSDKVSYEIFRLSNEFFRRYRRIPRILEKCAPKSRPQLAVPHMTHTHTRPLLHARPYFPWDAFVPLTVSTGHENMLTDSPSSPTISGDPFTRPRGCPQGELFKILYSSPSKSIKVVR